MTTILVIEDEQILSETLSYNLERAGFTVELAADGIAGLEKARELQPSLIILDVMLPGLDGFSICRTITRERVVPIIMLTALQDEAHRIAGLELGAIDYVTKPFSMVDLLACLMHNAGVALSRDLLLERVWGSEFPGSNRTIDVHIRWLREKLEQDPANPVMIHTVRGIGYRFQSPSSVEQPQHTGTDG